MTKILEKLEKLNGQEVYIRVSGLIELPLIHMNNCQVELQEIEGEQCILIEDEDDYDNGCCKIKENDIQIIEDTYANEEIIKCCQGLNLFVSVVE